MQFAAIADWADLGTYPVVFMCSELEVSRSSYYAGGGAIGQREGVRTVLVQTQDFHRLAGNDTVEPITRLDVLEPH